MFHLCTNLKTINLEGLIADEITDMKSMFELCSNLKYLNIKNLNSKHAFSVEQIFLGVNENIKIDYTFMITGLLLKEEIEKIKNKGLSS